MTEQYLTVKDYRFSTDPQEHIDQMLMGVTLSDRLLEHFESLPGAYQPHSRSRDAVLDRIAVCDYLLQWEVHEYDYAVDLFLNPPGSDLSLDGEASKHQLAFLETLLLLEDHHRLPLVQRTMEAGESLYRRLVAN